MNSSIDVLHCHIYIFACVCLPTSCWLCWLVVKLATLIKQLDIKWLEACTHWCEILNRWVGSTSSLFILLRISASLGLDGGNETCLVSTSMEAGNVTRVPCASWFRSPQCSWAVQSVHMQWCHFLWLYFWYFFGPNKMLPLYCKPWSVLCVYRCQSSELWLFSSFCCVLPYASVSLAD